LREPDIDYEKIELPAEGDLKFDFEVEVRPEFELPKLEGIPVEKPKHVVNDASVDREIEMLCKYAGTWTPKDNGKIELEDQVVADVMLNIEGQEQKVDNTEIYARANGFVADVPVEKLDEILIGAKAGDVKTAEVEVPKTFFREELRGKKVDIKITIKDIKWLKPAELNQDTISKCGVATEEELRKAIREKLESRLEGQAKQEMAEQIYKYLLDNVSFELPADVAADQAVSLLRRQYINLMMQGIDREQIDKNIEQLKANTEQQAKEQLKVFFIMDKISEKLEIKTTDEEINGHIAQLAIQKHVRPERMKEEMQRDGSLEQFKLQVREQKCVAKLLETANITEVEPKAHKHKAETPKHKKTTEKTEEKPAKKAETETKHAHPKKAKAADEEKPAKKAKAPTRKKKT
jgi:trigger factor